MRARRCVGFVGGVERIERELHSVAGQVGVDVEVHAGHTRGNGAARLAALIRRTHLVVIITGTNSHNAVLLAKREANRLGIPLRILKSCGVGTARTLLQEFSQEFAKT
ncbi:MAG: DUF2325 domain-containing protein [Polyangiaceae bacterium]|jgi:hypothetical protein